MVLNLPYGGESLFLQLLYNPLQKSLYILKWFLLILLFWLALGVLLVSVRPNYPLWIFLISLGGWAVGWLFVFKRTRQKSWFLVSFILLLLVVWFTLQVPFVQNSLVKMVTGKLSKSLNTTVKIDRISLSFFDKMEMEGLLIKDRAKDTLLYAGSAKVKITDWFFVREKTVLEYVGLSDAVINMNRKDTVWNYQFLVDYFSGPPKKEQKTGGIDLDLKEVNLNNIRFNQVDGWKGKNMLVALGKFELLADKIDLKGKQATINSLLLDKLVFTLDDYTGERDRLNIIPPPDIIDTTQPYRWNNDGWVINVKDLLLHNSTFNHNSETPGREAYNDQFDGSHLSFQNINAEAKNLRFEKDTLQMDMQLATKERSGFEIKQLKALFKFTPVMMEFNNLDIITNKSRLRDYYAMRYNSFDDDMGHFLHNVNLLGNFVNSEINSDDLAFFAPELKSWKRTFQIEGVAKGTIDNLSAKKMKIQSGSSSLDGDITIRGLPDIDETFIDFKSNDLQTNYTDLSAIIPALKNITQPQLSKLGNIRYQGNYTGFINDFVAFGTISTNLGTVTGDINLKLPEGKNAVYLGKISTDNFKLGAFLNTGQLGAVSFNGKIKGSGFSASTVDANFDGNVRNIEFGGYNYQNITLKGDFRKKLFNGTASIDDPNLKVDNLAGTIDFNEKEPGFKFDAALSKADFKKLGFSKDEYDLSGNFSLDFKGNNIDNFLGTARIGNASLLHAKMPLSFDSLMLRSEIVDGKKYLSLSSNEMDASIAGNFSILELPDAFTTFLSRYYPAYIKRPTRKMEPQDFSFEIRTKEIDPYINLVDKKLHGFNNSTISGNLKLKENELKINADVPEFSYDGRLFTNLKLDGKGNFDSLFTTVNVEDIAVNDSLHLPSTNLVFSSRNDTSFINLSTSASKTLSNATINTNLITLSDGVRLHFFPSSFIINDKKWQLEKDGEITFSKSHMSASEVKFVQGEQQITIATEPSSDGNSNDVLVGLTKINADEIVPYFLKQPRLEGLVTGNITIEDPFGKPFIKWDTQIEKFKTDGDSIGLVNAAGNYNINTGLIAFNADAENANNNFIAQGSINLKDSTENQTKISIKSNKLDLSILNAYLNSIFSDIKGTANTSDFSVTGNNKHLVVTGTANINEASLKVIYTQCVYKFSNESIIFNKDEIDFGKIILKDTLNNTATLSGKMYHHFFNDFEFDNLNFETNRLLVLNTTKKDNSQFYGKVIGKANMTINGSAEDILMNIEGEPTTTDSSHIYIISGNSIESGDIDYIDFVQFGTQQDFKSKSSSNILVNMALTANPSCKIDVILDESTGDVIKGEGSGLLKIRVGNKEPLSINGRYDIEKGDYTFNFQTFFKRPFKLNEGSIVWSGDPFQAKIDIIAEYLATKVDFRNLNYGSSTSVNNFQQVGDLIVEAHLTETLLKPAIDFEFRLPPGSPITDFLIIKRLEQFKQDKNDLNKQVTSLLLFNSFISPNQGILQTGSGFSVLSNTIGGIVSGWVSGFFNSFLQKYVKNLTFNFDANTSYGASDLQANVARLQAAAKSNFVYTLLNGRLILTAGVNLDYNNPYVTAGRNTNLLLTPDITAEWILTKDGKFRIIGFNRTNYDLTGQRNRTGMSLSYRRDFEKFLQLFGGSKSENK
ncbi:MAG: translocation/assembly module TamB domain-containing protein [Ferruginibacter sp.]